MNNREIWDAISTPPPEALKEIKGGRLRGMTDISPMWRWRKMTETFGPMGQGWGFEIDEVRSEAVDDEHVVTIIGRGWWEIPDKGGRNFCPGIGSSKLIAQEAGGAHVNDEAYKMAMTDAMGVAFKGLGLAADIYWEKGSSKYDKPGKPTPPPPKPASGDTMARLVSLQKTAGISPEDMTKVLAKIGLTDIAQLSEQQALGLIARIESKAKEQHGDKEGG